MQIPEEIKTFRKADYAINPLIESRWSARAMSGEKMIEEELMPLFDAARMAPSSYNNQPWRFLYAMRETKEWDLFFNLMADFNQAWTKNAAVLLVVVSNRFFAHNHKPSATHSYDTGAAWMNLSLEGNSRGLIVHGMQGFDYDRAKKDLEIPDDYQVEAMAAIGKKAPKNVLSAELQEREKPSPRNQISEFAFRGKFKKMS